ncbi:unnamed protein product [Acanthoscelides obtectus]|uniref:Uncharacterized protein n=1 Tax=Acanthoscelides obtectus TaxID=200917 RepID=A0A9P0P1G2_ACAOB|nr:unnamed protein product [Acanthoscelides obtectus]CAK1632630.1 hypothetical protein AOBTE_LOCUS7657 [Acanthoscelides obtectus]
MLRSNGLKSHHLTARDNSTLDVLMQASLARRCRPAIRCPHHPIQSQNISKCVEFAVNGEVSASNVVGQKSVPNSLWTHFHQSPVYPNTPHYSDAFMVNITRLIT